MPTHCTSHFPETSSPSDVKVFQPRQVVKRLAMDLPAMTKVLQDEERTAVERGKLLFFVFCFCDVTTVRGMDED